MTRATLLHVLDHPTSLGPAEVRELEQLAQAFPYCQTAHLLLAKAAHDQGTMLAGQRLRRAATYAADRTLLRRLIEHVEPALAEPVAAPAAEQPAALLTEAAEVPQPVAPTIAAEPPAAALPSLIEQAAEPEPTAASVATAVVAPAISSEAAEASEPGLLSFEQDVPPAELAPVSEEVPAPEVYPTASASVAGAPGSDSAEIAALLPWDWESADIPAPEQAPESAPKADSEESELPVQAPAIRPPVEVGEARFEFGLAEPPLVTTPVYELPGLVDEWAAADITRRLGGLVVPDALPATPLESSLVGAFTPAAFTGDDLIGYALGSSRMGFCLQQRPTSTDQVAAPEPDAGLAIVDPLPPTGALFEPDPLLLEYWTTHCPPPPALPSSLDLINNFLRRQPRLTRPAMLPTARAQADLSVRSTRVEPDLVSESLANILIRQGKTARAIEIYEKLMVKQPEKMAYFLAQINQLQPPA
ncbi:hypothetical protein IC235_08095 [Hymenobacter sp. BT664]|uniref:Tetratricopeptide repeat protein n=1 Tax=Hymenobacter montanus TaxID=2771359 RepID=A0A927BD44_9BACT|nr:hypothetical protein [Hymenobacter montanus]MBD2767852.1 hypothetical protein [Hymenobacter montanus]